MTDSMENDSNRRGFGLGITSLVLGILAAVFAYPTQHPAAKDTVAVFSFFAAIGLAFGIASIIQSSRPRSSAISGVLLSVCSALFVLTNTFILNQDSHTTTTTPAAQKEGRSDPSGKPIPASKELVWTPSYDCEKVSSGPERMICSNKELSGLDIQLNEAYSRAVQRASDREILKREQIDWLKHTRNNCSDSECMANAYRARISELSAK